MRFSTRKVEEVLGWRPPLDLAECLRRTYDAEPATWVPESTTARRNPTPNSTMPEPLKIAYLTSQYARVGDTFIRREVAQLRRLGHVVHTFSIRKADPGELISDEIRREQAQTEYLFEAGMGRLARAGLRAMITRPRAFLTAARTVFRSVPPGIPRRWIRRIVYLLEAAYLAEHLEARDVQHLHNHIGENSAVVAMLCSILTGIPYSLTIHGPGEFDRPTLLALDEKIRHAAFVVAITEFTRSQLYRWADYADWPKIHVVRVGARPDVPGARTGADPGSPPAGEYRPDRRAERPVDPGAGGGRPARPRPRIRAGHRGRRADARRDRAAHRPARPAGPGADHRLPGRPGGPPGAAKSRGRWFCPASPRDCRW